MKLKSAGFSLVEAMVGLGVISLGAVAMMQLTQHQSKNQVTADTKFEVLEVKRQIANSFASKQACELTLANFIIGQPLTQVLNAQGTPVFTVGENYGNNSVKLTSITSELKRDNGDQTYSADLIFSFENLRKMALVKKLPVFRLALQVGAPTVNSKVESCFYKDSLWSLNDLDIYNSNPGNVGIGTDTPKSQLHLMHPQDAMVGGPAVTLENSTSNKTFSISSRSDNSVPRFSIADDTLNQERIVINTAGLVGVGTMYPRTILHLMHPQDALVGGPAITLENSTSNKTFSLSSRSDNSAPRFSIADDTLNQERLTINSAGLVGVGVVDPKTELQVSGVISPATDNGHSLGNSTFRFTDVYAANGVINTSDRREKKDIREADLGMDFINKLRPISYRWNTGIDTEIHYGLIAQEANEALAEIGKVEKTSIISHDATTDRYGIRYSELLSPMIRAVQELYIKFIVLNGEMENIKATNALLKANDHAKNIEIAELKARLDKIEKTLLK